MGRFLRLEQHCCRKLQAARFDCLSCLGLEMWIVACNKVPRLRGIFVFPESSKSHEKCFKSRVLSLESFVLSEISLFSSQFVFLDSGFLVICQFILYFNTCLKILLRIPILFTASSHITTSPTVVRQTFCTSVLSIFSILFHKTLIHTIGDDVMHVFNQVIFFIQ